jgi:hypothetical protein
MAGLPALPKGLVQIIAVLLNNAPAAQKFHRRSG